MLRSIPGALFFVIGIIMLTQGCRNITSILATYNWQPTVASVSSVSVSVSNGARTTSYFPEIAYTYTVKGQQYGSNRISFETKTSYPSEGTAIFAAKKLRNKADSTKVVVFYDAADPREATIFKGDVSGEYYLLIMGSVFLLVGALLLRSKVKAVLRS